MLARCWLCSTAKGPAESGRAHGDRRDLRFRRRRQRPTAWPASRGGILAAKAWTSACARASITGLKSLSNQRARAPNRIRQRAAGEQIVADKHILHMLTPLKHMSPFDVNMALDAGYDAAIAYTNVMLDEVGGLVQDAIFSRPPKTGVRTGMFIGGKNAILALDMLSAAKKAL